MKDWFTYINAKYKEPTIERPCAPQIPTSTYDLKAYFGSTDFNSFNTDQKNAHYAVLNSLTTVYSSVRSGFLQLHTDDSVSGTEFISGTANAEYVGHVFGRMGQGAKTSPKWIRGARVQTAYQWTNPNATAHGMVVSVLPYDPAITGANYKFSVMQIPFANNTFYGPPIAPNITDPALAGSSKLAFGVVSLAALVPMFFQ